MNTISMDSEHILNFLRESYSLLIIPTIFGITFYILIDRLKWIGLIGIIFIVLYSFFIKLISKLASKYLKKCLRISDERNQKMTAALRGIKSVKFNGLEPIVENQSLNFKDLEYPLNFKIILIRTLLFMLSVIGPLCVGIFSISFKVLV